jgi:hypothetical protein
MGTSDPKPLSHGGISEAAAVAIYGAAASTTPPAPAPEPEEPEVGGDEGEDAPINEDGSVDEGDDVADPWDAMTTHAAIDAFVADPANGITTPEGWSSMTIAQKKGWLDANA